ncbi:TIGR03435 family protein [Acidobacteria bacterium AB60]|nr:TIGR03435 family protein [Acidobacteria bacterium AB60]
MRRICSASSRRRLVMKAESLQSILRSAGPFLANHLWQSTLVAAIAALLTVMLRRNRASLRAALWLVASLKFLLPFSLLIACGALLPHPHRVSLEQETTIYSALDFAGRPFHNGTPSAAPTPAPRPGVPLAVFLPETIAAIWLVGSLTVLLVWLRRWRHLHRSVSLASVTEDEREVRILRRLESEFQLRQKISVLRSQQLMEPGIFGILRPQLLWPEGLTERLNEEEIESLLAHELVHVLRRDNLVAALHMVVQTLFWFHPLVWWMERRMVEERERACDEAVVARGATPATYAEGLLKACRFCLESPLPCVSGVTGSDLSKRMVLIMRKQVGQRLDRSKKLLLAAAAFALLALPIAFGLERAAQIPTQTAGEPDWQAKAGGKMAFEVASIHPSRPDAFFPPTFALSPDGSFVDSAGHFRAVFPLMVYFQFAYKWMPSPAQSEALLAPLPKWVSTDYYVIEARAPGHPTKDQMRLMMQSLLADRFHLAMHYDTRPTPVYALVLDKPGVPGPQLHPHAEGPPCPNNIDLNDRNAVSALGGVFPPICEAFMERPAKDGQVLVGSRNTTMALLATNLTTIQDLGRPVVDETGLTGRFDFTLQWTPDANSTVPHEPAAAGELSGTTFLQALKEQLGVKLKPAKAPVQVPVIDHVERPSDN